MDGRVIVKLGNHEYAVVPQRFGYLLSLGSDLEHLLGGEGNIGQITGRSAHALLSKLLPDFMPEWEFMGYGSESAYAERHYQRELDASPTPPEVFHAIRMIGKVNGGDAVDFLKGLVGPEMIQKLIALAIAEASERSSTSSPSSPQPNGASAPTSSGVPIAIAPRTDI